MENGDLATVGQLYEAALDPEAWPRALQGLARAAGSQGANWLSSIPSGQEAAVVHSFGNDPEAVAAYHARFAPLDPLTRRAARTPPGIWTNDWREFEREGYARSEYYNEFIRRYDNHAVMTVNLLCADDFVAAVSFQRRAGQPRFDTCDEERLAGMLPHLFRFARLLRETGDLRSRLHLAEAALARAGYPVWIVDREGRVLFANPAAERLAAAGQGWSFAFGRLRRTKRDDEFGRALRAATLPGKGQASWITAGCGSDAERPFLVAPLGPRSPLCRDFQRPLAIVTGPDAGNGGRMAMEALQALFGLTQAEARAAALVGAGDAPAEVATVLGLSVATVRVQLRAAFAKIGIRRQSDLVRLVADLERHPPL